VQRLLGGSQARLAVASTWALASGGITALIEAEPHRFGRRVGGQPARRQRAFSRPEGGRLRLLCLRRHPAGAQGRRAPTRARLARRRRPLAFTFAYPVAAPVRPRAEKTEEVGRVNRRRLSAQLFQDSRARDHRALRFPPRRHNKAPATILPGWELISELPAQTSVASRPQRGDHEVAWSLWSPFRSTWGPVSSTGGQLPGRKIDERR
jgi:hypothetical protein